MMGLMIANQKMIIEDVLSNITIVNTSVCQKHKVERSSHGERKIYLPGNIDEKYRFFEDFSQEIKGFVWRENLKEYLLKAKKEYYHPSKEYNEKNTMKLEYQELWNKVCQLDEVLPFKIKKADVKHAGLYINQDSGKKTDKNWNLITDIALPDISRLSIIKGIYNGTLTYYFKLNFGTMDFEDTEQEDMEIEKIQKSKKSITEKEAIIMARVGQGKYRKKLLEEISYCPFTLVDDEHLLVASHIKPWKDANSKEKKDPKNGFVFTPTYDKLFDRGYISFEDDKSLIISPWLSKYNCEKLNLKKGMVIEKLPVIDEKRKKYLEYHRRVILKKLEEL